MFQIQNAQNVASGSSSITIHNKVDSGITVHNEGNTDVHTEQQPENTAPPGENEVNLLQLKHGNYQQQNLKSSKN